MDGEEERTVCVEVEIVEDGGQGDDFDDGGGGSLCPLLVNGNPGLVHHLKRRYSMPTNFRLELI